MSSMDGVHTDSDRKVWIMRVFFFLVFVSSALTEDTVLDDIGPHQLERLVDMLTIIECENLLITLSQPEEDILQKANRLSPENNNLGIKSRGKRDTSTAVAASPSSTYHPDFKHRTKRDASSVADPRIQCRAALTDWLLRYGEQIYFDRFSRALHHIGRTDIASEVGKNINQEKILALKRYVEDYHKFVSSHEIPKVKEETKKHHRKELKIFKREVRDLSWRDLDLIMMQTQKPDQKNPLDLFLPLLYGLLLGFGGSLIVVVSAICFLNCPSYRKQLKRRPSLTSIWIQNTQNERVRLIVRQEQ